ncbi:MAG TPA: hypothetical protein PK322_12005 [Opitutaceae bacterium]|nr:hypothetical protein [Opitutaceae bacterium]
MTARRRGRRKVGGDPIPFEAVGERAQVGGEWRRLGGELVEQGERGVEIGGGHGLTQRFDEAGRERGGAVGTGCLDGRGALVAQVEQAAEALEKLVVAEGFSEEVVDALHGVAQFLDDAGGEAEDADVAASFQLADTAGGRSTVHVGHAQIHEDGAGAALLEPRDGLEAVCRRVDLEADRAKERLEEPAAVLLVVDDEERAWRLVRCEAERAGWRGGALAGGFVGRGTEAEGDGEDAAAALDAAHGDIAFHHAGELAADGETEAGARAGAAACGRLLELLEESVKFVGRDAGAGVLDLGMDQPVLTILGQGVQAQCDGTVFGELHGVAEEVDEDLADLGLVGEDGGGQICGDLGGEREAFGGDAGGECGAYVGDELAEVAGGELERGAPGLDLGELEHVVEEGEEEFAVAVDGLEVGPLLGGDRRVAEHELAEAEDGVHRRADLVRHVGEEHALGLVCDLGLGLCGLQFGHVLVLGDVEAGALIVEQVS